MEEIAQRLKEASASCATALDAWGKDKKDRKLLEALQESVHELRKVASRLEIEMAVSERDQMAQKPIPVPNHRDSNKKPKNDDRGNRAPKGNDGGGKPKRGPKPPQKKAAGGEG